MVPLEVQKAEGYQNIYQLDCFASEFQRTVLGRSDQENKRYVAWLYRSLAILDQRLEGAVVLEQFEKLSNTNIYSVRYPHSKKNPRVLYYFFKGGTPVLLGSFLEKSSSDYNRNIKLAEERAASVSKQYIDF